MLFFSYDYGYVYCLVYKKINDAMKKYPDADVIVSFASLRSAYESTVEAMEYPQVCLSVLSSLN